MKPLRRLEGESGDREKLAELRELPIGSIRATQKNGARGRI